MPLYEQDLALVHAEGFGGYAEAALSALMPVLHGSEPPVRRVLDVGCGAGAGSKALVRAGFEVIGLDPSEALLDHARRAAPEGTFLRRSAYGEPLPPADAVVAIGEPLTYHALEADAGATLRAFFAEVARALPEGGWLMFDLIDAEGPPLSTRSFRSAEDWLVVSETVEDIVGRRLVRRIETFVREPGSDTYRRRRETHHVKLFARSQVIEWLEAAGFEPLLLPPLPEAARLPRRFALGARRAKTSAISPA
ncbi:MAG: class I SAM-dependent methyltransferase [Myxococcales bacterium]|nr:class I SAM-dependent methyltransferase [Myxococcales bacterium]